MVVFSWSVWIAGIVTLRTIHEMTRTLPGKSHKTVAALRFALVRRVFSVKSA